MANFKLEGTLVFNYQGSPTSYDVEGNLKLDGTDLFGVFHVDSGGVNQYVPIRTSYDGTTATASDRTMVFRKETFGLSDDLVLSCDIVGTVGEPSVFTITGTGLVVTVTVTSIDQVVNTSYGAAETVASMTPTTYEIPTPTRVNLKHDPFLNTAAILGVSVLPEDSNQQIKQKILRAASETRNSTYEGLVNSVSQDLNLDKTEVIRITRKGVTYEDEGTPGVIEVDGGFLRLYTEKFDNENFNLDLEVSIRQGLSTISDLVTYINNHSAAFEATTLDKEYTDPKTLMIQSNIKDVFTETLESTTHIKLEHDHIVPGSIKFSNSNIFKKEVGSQAELLDGGDFYPDTENGVIWGVSLPELGDFISYKYVEWPYELVSSDVVINTMDSRALRRHIFTQNSTTELQTKDPTQLTFDGLPTMEGAGLIAELLLKSANTMWGK